MGDAANKWANCLAQWSIPDHITAAAPRSPWGFPVEVFAARAEEALRQPDTPTSERARAALSDWQRPTLLDVGCGAGYASLPLVPPAAQLTGVDSSADMLTAFSKMGRERGAEVRTVEGRWPDVRPEVAPHDVVVCSDVVYGVPEIEEFVLALTATAKALVVLELPVEHPLAWMSPLWETFHGLQRPVEPVLDDFLDVLVQLSLPGIEVIRWNRAERDPAQWSERVARVTTRLCLPSNREPEVAQALSTVLTATRPVATVSWQGAAAR